MAKRGTQAAAIREALGKLGIDTPARQVAEHVDSEHRLGLLKKKNFNTLVSIERSKMRRGGKPIKRRVKVRRNSPATAAGMDGLMKAVEFIRGVGGLDEAKRLIAQVEAIQNL